MMKITSFTLFLMCCYCCAQSQSLKSLDFIIMVDEKIVEGSITTVQLKTSTKRSEKNFVAEYHPGNLSLKQEDFEEILSDSTKSVYLCFDYSEFGNGNQTLHSYKIEIKKPWLMSRYCIFRIYNLYKKKYKKAFDSPANKGKEYVFELDSPGNTFYLLRNR